MITHDWIDRYNEGSLSEKELDAFRNQMAIDPLLRAETRMDAELDELLSDSGCLELMRNMKNIIEKERARKPAGGYYLMAAAILLVLVISGFLLYFEGLKGSVIEQKVASEQPVIQSRKTESLLDRDGHAYMSGKYTPVSRREKSKTKTVENEFLPLPELELLTGNATRSSIIKVISPVNGLTVRLGESVAFRWRTGPCANFQFYLLDNRGFVVFDKTGLTADGFELETSTLRKGLFYWKIQEGENLAAVGKMLIR